MLRYQLEEENCDDDAEIDIDEDNVEDDTDSE